MGCETSLRDSGRYLKVGTLRSPKTSLRHRDLGAQGRREGPREVIRGLGSREEALTKETSDLLCVYACGYDHQAHWTDTLTNTVCNPVNGLTVRWSLPEERKSLKSKKGAQGKKGSSK